MIPTQLIDAKNKHEGEQIIMGGVYVGTCKGGRLGLNANYHPERHDAELKKLGFVVEGSKRADTTANDHDHRKS